MEDAIKLIDKHSKKNYSKINSIWARVYETIKDKNDKRNFLIREVLEVPLDQVEMRSSLLPLYNMLTHAVEFRKENELLAKRYQEMKKIINSTMALAKKKLTPADYKPFVLSYQQARNFSMYKDVMGELDSSLLPLWFGLTDKVRAILSRNYDISSKDSGPSIIFRQLVWHLPNDLKAKVMSVDNTPFSLEKL